MEGTIKQFKGRQYMVITFQKYLSINTLNVNVERYFFLHNTL